jgi:serine/threonine protein kinase
MTFEVSWVKAGWGGVVRARDKKLDRDVAIKFLVPELARHEAARERFLREARAAAAVRHDNVVTIHSVREVDGVPLPEMELIDGRITCRAKTASWCHVCS